MIEIHYDYTIGNEVSYVEGLKLKDNFSTHCLDFFCFDCEAENVVVKFMDGGIIDRNELLSNTKKYTEKQIRAAHNISKMLKAGSFNPIYKTN